MIKVTYCQIFLNLCSLQTFQVQQENFGNSNDEITEVIEDCFVFKNSSDDPSFCPEELISENFLKFIDSDELMVQDEEEDSFPNNDDIDNLFEQNYSMMSPHFEQISEEMVQEFDTSFLGDIYESPVASPCHEIKSELGEFLKFPTKITEDVFVAPREIPSTVTEYQNDEICQIVSLLKIY